MTRTLDNPQQALFSIEFQAGGSGDMGSGQTSMADLHSRLVISVNMRAINHYLFVSGENHPLISPTRRHDWGHPVRVDGTTRKTYDRYPKLSRVLAAYGQALVGARNQTVATVGFMIDDYMNEVNLPATQEATRILTHQRDEVLFDFIARGLALSHRPFDALELARDPLDPALTPVLFAFMEKQCDPGVQQKLVDYVRAGGRLLLAGRMCEQTFDHQPCTLLKDALGITAIQPDPAWTQATIRALGYEDIPASIDERYQGEFGEVIATTLEGETVGFIQPLGKGRALVFGAAMTAHTLEDLDVFERMAEKLDCRPLFQLSDWADVRISRGEQGSFLFAANYLDDPVETTIRCSGEALFGGGAVTLPARRGLILPLGWQARPGVNIHYATAEITGVEERADGLVFTTEPAQFTAELGLEGYTCEGALSLGSGRVRVSGKDGVIMLQKA
jgi:beta-galactosidase